MDLLAEFNDFIVCERLFANDDKLLLAVSGGVDSVVLAELCHRCGYAFVIAHCNFQLRGEESERDEQFVRGLGERYGAEVLVERFDTARYAADRRVSIQVAARELRYAWFEGIVKEGGVRWIVTAHQLDDNIETMLMHFFKGTGITGMRGMLPKQGNLVRPLLFTKKEELTVFARNEGLDWVEDSSNASDKYTRNFFRHRVIPLIEEVYPGAAANLAANLQRFRETESVYQRAIGERLTKLMEYRGQEVHVPVEKLRKERPLATIIYEMIEPFGFSPKQVGEVMTLMDSSTGRYVRSETHRIIKNRNWLILSPIGTKRTQFVVIEEGQGEVGFIEGGLHLSLHDAKTIRNLDQGANTALLDAAKISYPLLLRRWKAGDYFYPLGLRKKKKIARFLIDSKVSLADKEKVWVLESDKKLVWVVGRRLDDRLKVSPSTQRILRIEFTVAKNADA